MESVVTDNGAEIASSSTKEIEVTENRSSDKTKGDEGSETPATSETDSSSKVISSASPSADAKKNEGNEETGFAFTQPLLPPPPLKFCASPTSSTGISSSTDKSLVASSPTPEQLQRKAEKRARAKAEKEEKYQQILSSLDYHPPEYGAPCADTRYNFEVLKNGTIVDSVKFSSFDRKGYYIIGRVPGCDIVAENPTVSRMHAILQFVQCPKGESKEGEDCTDSPRQTGLYLYDLKSTHGSYLNKNQLFPHKFYRVHVGHVLKFGSSQRMYIVNGPDDDEEEESDKTVTELLNERLQKDLERKRLEEQYQLKQGVVSKLPSDNIEEEGITWGMREDADEESDMRINPFAMDYETSELTLDNPKKTLRSWFEREGHDLEYEVREKSSGQYVCRIGLPIDGPTDSGMVYAESEVKGKKKEAAHDAAMKACKILDSHGLLRTSNQESRKRKEKKWEDEDYYSSDEDTFLDRTGSIEKKREKRMRLAGKAEESGSVLTYDSLCAKDAELEKEIKDLQEQIEKSQRMKERADDGDVDIDDYLTLLKSGVFDLKKLKGRLKTAQEESGKTKKLMQIAKPAELPAYLQVKPSQPTDSPPKDAPTSSSPKIAEAGSSEEVISEEPAVVEEAEPKPRPRPPPMIGKKPIVGPRKPTSSTTVPEPKRFGLITPSEFANLKTSATRVPAVRQPAEENEDAPFEEEMDSSSSAEEEQDEANSTESTNDNPTSSSNLPEFTKPTKKKRQRYRNQQKNKQNAAGNSSGQSYQDDSSYSEWVPPMGQTGDGRTSLNEKLGY